MFSFLAGGRTDRMQRCFAWYDKAVLMASGMRENYFKVFEKMSWSVTVCFCVIYKFSLIQNFKK